VCRQVRTSRAATLTAAILVIAAVGVGYAVVHNTHPTVRLIVTPTPVPLPSTPAPRDPVLTGLAATAPTPVPRDVAATLAPEARAVAHGAHLAGEVIDARTGKRLWSRGADRPEPPASTTKLMTAAAALSVLGPDFRLSTTTRRIGHTVYLVGGGDPTLALTATSPVDPAYPRPVSLAALARRTVAALGSTDEVRLRVDSSIWTGPEAAPGWKPSYFTEGDIARPSPLELDEGRLAPNDTDRTPTPAAQAGDAFAQLLRSDGLHVVGHPKSGTATAASTPLAKVESPPLSQLVQRMLTVSDDDLAEALGRALARHVGRPASFAGAAKAVTTAVAKLDVPTRGVSLQDTSGLSHLDRVTPRALVAVLRAATSPAHPDLQSLVAGLPVAGLTGTLSDRFAHPPTVRAAGMLRAKTGTLTGVNALAGTVVDHSGRLLVFAFLASHASLPGLTVPALDHLASQLARCGCDS
jgi:D-alanyl-D-alanine carboxypeptidase/D-alanyl-D-alanine-endopeptidase (penicillin-binding protein 4)